MGNRDDMLFRISAGKINRLQVDSLRNAIKRAKAAHFTDLDIRINGQNERIQADWLKHFEEVTPSLSAAPPPPVSDVAGWPHVRGIGRMFDNEKALLISLDRKPTDDELRAIHDFLNDRTADTLDHLQAPESRTPRCDALAKTRNVAYWGVPFDFAMELEAGFTDANREIERLERQRDELRTELDAARKLVNIYRGAVTSAFQCEKHDDVIAEHCPVCLLEERDELMEAAINVSKAYSRLCVARAGGELALALTVALEYAISLSRKEDEFSAAMESLNKLLPQPPQDNADEG